MRKIIYYTILSMIAIFPNKVLAKGDILLSHELLTIEQGSTETFKITAYNTIGDVKIKSNNTEVANVDVNEWETGMIERDQTIEATINVNGKSIGTTQIVIEIDAATFDNEDLSEQTRTITINVIEKTNSSNSEIEDDNEEQENETNQDDTPENIGGDEESNQEAEEEIEIPSYDEEIDNPPTGSKKLLVMILIVLCASTVFIIYQRKYK